MPVAHEEVHQPIIGSIANIQEGHLIEKCSVANGVKRLKSRANTVTNILLESIVSDGLQDGY